MASEASRRLCRRSNPSVSHAASNETGAALHFNYLRELNKSMLIVMSVRGYIERGIGFVRAARELILIG